MGCIVAVAPCFIVIDILEQRFWSRGQGGNTTEASSSSFPNLSAYLLSIRATSYTIILGVSVPAGLPVGRGLLHRSYAPTGALARYPPSPTRSPTGHVLYLPEQVPIFSSVLLALFI